jgi:hypothetical protein
MTPLDPSRYLGLFVLDMDIHPDYDLDYQTNQYCEGYRGIGLFFTGWPPEYYGGKIQVTIPQGAPAGTYTFKARFCKPFYCDPNYPHPVAANPLMRFRASTESWTGTWGPWTGMTTCVDSIYTRNILLGYLGGYVMWEFGLKDFPIVFARVEVTHTP